MGEVRNVTDAEYEAAVNDSEWVIVDFWAPWCSPCKAIAPILQAVSDERDILIAKVDTASDETLTEQNAHNISAIVFYSVQLLEQRDALAMAADNDLDLAVNRLKSLQKLYLFEQKGGENYLG